MLGLRFSIAFELSSDYLARLTPAVARIAESSFGARTGTVSTGIYPQLPTASFGTLVLLGAYSIGYSFFEGPPQTVLRSSKVPFECQLIDEP